MNDFSRSMCPPKAAKLFLIVWILSHVFYPIWFPFSGNFAVSIAAFSACAAIAAVLTRLLAPSIKETSAEEDALLGRLLRIPPDPVLWVLAIVVALLHAYPLTLPVHYWEGGDEAAHMGVPALPFKVLARHLPFPYTMITWVILALCYPFRARIIGLIRRAAADLIDFKLGATSAAFAALVLFFAGSFVVMQYFWTHGHPTMILDVLRFPPLCKWIRIPIYALVGVSNLTGRAPEILFYLAAGVVIYKFGLEFKSLAIARFLAASYWLMPPIAYYSMRGSQTEGELFFFILTAYFYGLWLRDRKPAALYWTAVSVSVGTMYRYTLPVLGAIVGLHAAVSWLIDPEERSKTPLRPAIESAMLMALMIIPWTLSFYVHQLRRYDPSQQPAAAHGFITTWHSLAQGVSWPMAVLMGMALFAAAARKKDSLQKFLLIWVAVYYVFISTDMAEVVRLNLPLYPPLLVFTAEAFLTILPGRAIMRWGAVVTAAYLFVISTLKAAPPMEPRYAMLHSLENEYIPLTAGADELNRIPEGTRLLSIDCSQGCFTLYLKRPKALDWTIVDSRKIPSMEDLHRICVENRIQVVMYMAGTVEAFNYTMNPDLFSEFERGAPWLAPRAAYQIGKNKIVFKNVNLDTP